LVSSSGSADIIKFKILETSVFRSAESMLLVDRSTLGNADNVIQIPISPIITNKAEAKNVADNIEL